MIPAIESSAVFRAADRTIKRLSAARSSSTFAAAAARPAASWQAMAWNDRRRFLGVTLVVAPAVHLALMMGSEAPPGWLWLLVPFSALAAGLILLAMPGSSGTEHDLS